MDTKSGLVSVTNADRPQDPPKEFTFDAVYDFK